METPNPRAVLRLEADHPTRLVVLRALQFGDLLCAVPALRALRSAVPTARIALVGLPWAREFAARFASYLDEFIEFPGYPGLPERPVEVEAVPAFLAEIQQRRFDLAIQMHGDGRITNGLVALFGARRMAGFGFPGDPLVEHAALLPYPSWLPEVRRHLCLVEWLGAPIQSERLEFPVSEAEERAWAALRRNAGLEGSYACVHAGARDPARRWPIESFAEVAQAVAARGLRVVLTGEGDEGPRARAIANCCPVPLFDLTGQTTLGVLAAAVRGARLLVCNDTGVSHLAAAMSTPSVIVFLASDPDRWAPLDRGRHRVVRGGPLAVRTAVSEIGHLLAGEGARVA
jgi:ADP-heptose:LPS heptosyltransferase